MRYNKTTTSKLSKYPVSTLIYIPSTAEPQKSFSFSTCTMLRWKGGYFVALAPNRPSVLLASRCIVDLQRWHETSLNNATPRHANANATPRQVSKAVRRADSWSWSWLARLGWNRQEWGFVTLAWSGLLALAWSGLLALTWSDSLWLGVVCWLWLGVVCWLSLGVTPSGLEWFAGSGLEWSVGSRLE